MPKFSIVIPCYNSFEKMNSCLQSLENQTYKDFEVVFVDDFSKDNTYENLENYLKNSKLNYKLIKNEKNLGAGFTRNNGIEKSTGEYLIFLDADDYIENNSLEEINNIIKKEKVECIFFDYYYRTKNNNIYYKTVSNGKNGIISKSNALINTTGSTCCKVYLLQNILKNNVRFPDLIRNEDMVFNKIAISNCNSFYYLEKPFYNYIKYEDSLMSNKELLTEQNAIKGFEMIESKLKSSYPEEVEAMFIKEYFYSTTMTLIEKKRKNKEIKQHIIECEKKYENLYENKAINDLAKYQKIFIFFAKKKMIVALKILVCVKKIINRIR